MYLQWLARRTLCDVSPMDVFPMDVCLLFMLLWLLHMAACCSTAPIYIVVLAHSILFLYAYTAHAGCESQLGHRLSDVGSALSECTSLAELRVSHNTLASLPQDLSSNPRLKIIEAAANQIAKFQDIQVSFPYNFVTSFSVMMLTILNL